VFGKADGFAASLDLVTLDGSNGFRLDGIDFDGRFVIGATAADASYRLIYNSANGQLFFDSDGTGAQAQVLIATLTGAPALAATDFVVI